MTESRRIASLFAKAEGKVNGIHKKNKKSLEEVELEKALALSEAEAKVANMDDEARIKAAIEESLNEKQDKEIGSNLKRKIKDERNAGSSSPAANRRP